MGVNIRGRYQDRTGQSAALEIISTLNSGAGCWEQETAPRLAFGARRFPFPALAAMSAFSNFAPSFETPAASSDRSAFPAESRRDSMTVAQYEVLGHVF
jgi:hypothetical protein